ncbi:hypothetical protein AVEN_119810-1 [Araneus ventricosus]|uniref:Uncharacterized protein n=1 Tax=Araneus ventricosus TaxID=182803 RepID=A0A4Y2RA20_ARAVE|nr:hypothetical protein AVEN_119810-1 [Araneus ventricosus]
MGRWKIYGVPAPRRGTTSYLAKVRVLGFEVFGLNFPQFDGNRRMLNNRRRVALVKWRRSSNLHLHVKVEAGTEVIKIGAGHFKIIMTQSLGSKRDK